MFCGFGGDDDIDTLAKDDIFLGGLGNDQVGTDAGDPVSSNYGTFNGGEGNDWVTDNRGTYVGGEGNDTVGTGYPPVDGP